MHVSTVCTQGSHVVAESNEQTPPLDLIFMEIADMNIIDTVIAMSLHHMTQ